MKYDLKNIVEKVQKLYDKTPSEMNSIGLGSSLKSMAIENFFKMPKWWVDATKTPGIPLGSYVVVSGETDSGKTSCALEAMKAAQDQGFAVLYAETENKTSREDLKAAGVDDTNIMIVAESVAESLFKKLFQAWDEFFKAYPNGKLLVIVDSLGNVLSKHDEELDMETQSQKPGGKGKSNRLGIGRLISKGRRNKVAMLLVTYTYDNIGAPGKTNAGGRALNLYSSLTYQTSRKQWLEKTVKGEKIRIGARVQWKLYKNHINKSHPGPKIIEFDITAKGIEYVGGSDS